MANPSPLELKLLKAIWQHNQLSAREIQQATEADTGWSYSTTRKTLDRMEEKGLVSVELVHGLKTYVANQSKLTVMAGLISDFAKNILEADEPLPAATFAHSKLISQDEIDDLKSILEQKAEEEGAA